MSTSEKDKLVNGNEIRKLNEDYQLKNQEEYFPNIVTLTPKRRYDDTDNEVQEKENDNFQIARKKHQKRNYPLLKSVIQNFENILNQVSTGSHQSQNINDNSTRNQV